MKKINFTIALAIIMLVACTKAKQTDESMQNNKSKTTDTVVTPKPTDVMASVTLTVAEGKRLIAKGIARHPLVQEKLKSGTIIITRGTTNTYIAEELAKLPAPHGKFVTGNVTPVKGKALDFGHDKVPEIVLTDGKQVDISYKEALETLKKDDIIFKGANLLNYAQKQAAVTVAAADGGTVGRLQPFTGEGQAHLIVPVGLEKGVSGDLLEYEKVLTSEVKKEGFVPKIIVHKNAEIFTEIEALKLFGDVNVVPYAHGGVNGQEGGISLAVYGDAAEVKKVLAAVESIQGEKAFGE